MVRIAIVGAGGISLRHVAALQKISDAHIVGVIDISMEKAQQLAGICGAKVFDRLSDCLDLVDVVYILTPPSSHREIAVEAMQAGKHVVCEKPISISLADAHIMIETSKKMNVKLIIAFKSRFRKGFKLLKELVDSGKLGNAINFWSQRLGMGAGTSSNYNWRTDQALMCGMSIESLSHDIDTMRWLVGDIIDVRANIFESRKDIPGFDDNVNVVMTLANAGTAMIHASWSSYISMSSRGIIGTKGTAYLQGPDLFDNRYLHYKTIDMQDEFIQFINDPNNLEGFINENRYFIDCILNDIPSTVTGEDGLKTLQISHAILKSHQEKRVVRIDEFGGQLDG